MNLADCEYPEAPEHRRTTHRPHAARPIGALIAVACAGALLVAIVAMITYQLAHPPKPMGLYPTSMGTGDQGLGIGNGTSDPPTTAAPRTGVLHTPSAPAAPTPNPRYDRQLPASVLAGFGKQPRDLNVGGRQFMLLGCDGWECQIELDDGAKVWVSVEQAGEPAPTPAPPPRATVRVPVMVCADATGINGSIKLCAPDGDYTALLAQAHAQAGPPIAAPPTLDPAVLAAATQHALDGNATAYAVQTAEAVPTPVAAQQVR